MPLPSSIVTIRFTATSRIALHARQMNQFRVTVERKASGPLQSPRIELARQGLAGTVTIDGYLP